MFDNFDAFVENLQERIFDETRKAFGEAGNGIFPAPAAISDEVEQMYRCRRIGQAIPVVEKYYAISPERKLKHPAVLQVIENARKTLLLG